MRLIEHTYWLQRRAGSVAVTALTAALALTFVGCPKPVSTPQPSGTGGVAPGGGGAGTGGNGTGGGGAGSGGAIGTGSAGSGGTGNSVGSGGGASGGRTGSGGGSAGTGGRGTGGGTGGISGGSGGGAGMTAGSCVGALLCENFEAYTTGNAPVGPWKISTNLGTVRVDATRASSGTKAVRFTTDGATGTYRRAFMSIEGAPVFPVAGNVFYGRMMVWLVAAPAGSVHWTNIQGEGPVANMNFRAFSRYGGQQQKRLMANYETQGVASDCWKHSTTLMPEGRWTCMEWRFSGPNNEMNFWLDGMSLSDMTVVGRGEGCISQGTAGNWYAPTYDTIRLGWEHYQQSVAHDMWIDDVAIDVKRIGCPIPTN